MKPIVRSIFILVFFISSFTVSAQNSKYKCMLQMSNYMGEGAYIVVSLINPHGKYEKTLYVLGDDKKWYKSLKESYAFYSKKPSDISAKTGASVTGGDRSSTTLEIEDSKINAGYKLRFQTAVEDQKYYANDIEINLNTEQLSSKTEGKNYIKYVRLIKV